MSKLSLKNALEHIAGNLYLLRKKNGLTQTALAKATDIDIRYLQRVERGSTNLSMAVLVTLANTFKVEPTAFFKPAKVHPAKVGRPRLAAKK